MPAKNRNSETKSCDMKGMDRRSFLKKTAVVSGATVVSATLGYGARKSEAASIPTQGTTEDLPTGCVVNPEIPPDPISESSIKSTLSADVVIVGAGVTGLSAARAASEAGASVIVIDKANTYSMAGQFGVIDSRVHKHFNIKIDKNALVLDALKQMSFRANQRIWKYWAENSGAAFDWMLELAPDVGFLTEEQDPPATSDESKMYVRTLYYPRPAGYDPSKELSPSYPTTLTFVSNFESMGAGAGGAIGSIGAMGAGGAPAGPPSIMDLVYKRCLDKGCKFIFSTWARQLIRPGNKGRVQGVICQDKNGVYTKILAKKGVILAAGDYGSNKEMLAYYTPWALKCVNFWAKKDAAGKPTNTGDGQLMGVWVGAKMEDGPHAPMTHTMGGHMGTDSFFLANAEGERFVNEDLGGQWLSNALYRQPGNFGWQIFDDKWPEQIIHMAMSHGSINFFVDEQKNPELKRVGRQGLTSYKSREGLMSKDTMSMSGEALKTADTLKELVGKLKLDAKAQIRLLESIERYNMLAKKGVDEDFGKVAKRLYPIENPPFYATKITAGSMLVCMGGLTCEPETGNVQDKEYKRIEGLYAAGNTMGGRFLVDYPVVAAGISFGMALTQGRLVGTVAAGV